MSSSNETEPPIDLSFGDLLDWHLRCGTRPPGDEKQGEPWGKKAFAEDCRVSRKQLSNWVANTSLPVDTLTVERVLFGTNQDYRPTWRIKLRDAHKRTRNDLKRVRLRNASTRPDGGAINQWSQQNNTTEAVPRNDASALAFEQQTLEALPDAIV